MVTIEQLKNRIIDLYFPELESANVKLIQRKEEVGVPELKKTPSGYFIFADYSLLGAPSRVIVGGIGREFARIVRKKSALDLLLKTYSEISISTERYTKRDYREAEKLMVRRRLGEELSDFLYWSEERGIQKNLAGHESDEVIALIERQQQAVPT